MSQKPKVSLMMDSGVFSAWNRGETLPLKEYIAYLKEHRKLFASYVSMDSIPGAPGKPRKQAEVEHSAELSYKNQQIMKDAGLSPIPVFHQGENFKCLERYLKDGEPYIGIGTLKDLSATDNAQWLDVVFSMLTDAEGRPIVRTHGFGVTKSAFLARYPFSTVDSTTWSLNAGFGAVILPSMGTAGKPDYTRSVIVHISGVQQQSGSMAKSFESMGPLMRDWVIKCLANAGTNLTEARNFPTARRRTTLHFYMRLAETLLDVRFTHHYGEVKHNRKPIAPQQLEIIFSTAITNREFSEALTDAKANYRLLSWYDTRKRDDKLLTEYVKQGIITSLPSQSSAAHDWSKESYLNRRKRAILARNARTVDEERPPWE